MLRRSSIHDKSLRWLLVHNLRWLAWVLHILEVCALSRLSNSLRIGQLLVEWSLWVLNDDLLLLLCHLRIYFLIFLAQHFIVKCHLFLNWFVIRMIFSSLSRSSIVTQMTVSYNRDSIRDRIYMRLYWSLSQF